MCLLRDKVWMNAEQRTNKGSHKYRSELAFPSRKGFFCLYNYKHPHISAFLIFLAQYCVLIIWWCSKSPEVLIFQLWPPSSFIFFCLVASASITCQNQTFPSTMWDPRIKFIRLGWQQVPLYAFTWKIGPWLENTAMAFSFNSGLQGRA